MLDESQISYESKQADIARKPNHEERLESLERLSTELENRLAAAYHRIKQLESVVGIEPPPEASINYLK